MTTCLLFSLSVAQENVIDNNDYNLAVNFYTDAVNAYSLKQYESALDNFVKAHSLNDKNADYPFGIANSFYELKQYDSASKYIEIAILLEPDYHNRAGNIYFHSKDYRKAFDNYTIAISNLNDEYYVNPYSCYYNKAVSAFYLKDYQSAIEGLTYLISEDSTDFDCIHLRGVSYLKAGKTQDACQNFKVAKSLGNEASQKYLDRYCK